MASGYIELDALERPDDADVGDTLKLDSQKRPRWSAGGGSQPQTQTATLTTDINTFLASHTFDLGSAGPHPLQITLTALVLTPDGETFGNGAGQIYAGPSSTTTDIEASVDNALWRNIATEIAIYQGGDGINFSFEVQSLVVPAIGIIDTVRYVKIPIAIVGNDSGAVYAGANHPQAQVRIDVRYL